MLAVTLVASNAAYSLSTSLYANEDVIYETDPGTDQGTGAELGAAEGTEAAPVSEVNESTDQVTIEDVSDQPEVTAAQPETQETVPAETPAEDPAAETVPEEQAVEPQIVEYNVMVESVGGNGLVRVTAPTYAEIWAGGNTTVVVNDQNPAVAFDVTPDEGFEIQDVRVDGNIVNPTTVNGNVSYYDVNGIVSDTYIRVTFAAKPVEVPEATEPVVEEKPETEVKEETKPEVTEEEETQPEVKEEEETQPEVKDEAENEDQKEDDQKTDDQKDDQKADEEKADDQNVDDKKDDQEADDQKADAKEDEDQKADAKDEKDKKADAEKDEDKKADDEEEQKSEDEKDSEDKKADMPAQTLTADVNGMTVIVRALQGALPEGTTMKAYPVFPSRVQGAIEETLEEGEEITDIKAVDITLYDKDGNEIQPENGVSVTFAGVSASAEADSTAVYHVDDAGASADEMKEVGSVCSSIAVSTDHFSIYVVVNTSSPETKENITDTVYYCQPGEEITIEGSTGNNILHPDWEITIKKVGESEDVSNTDIITLTEINDSEAKAKVKVKDNAPIGSEAEVTYTYKDMDPNKRFDGEVTEKFIIKVSSEEKEKNALVYLYVNVGIAIPDWGSPSEDGKNRWYTIGYAEVPDLNSASDEEKGTKENLLEEVANKINFGNNVTLYKEYVGWDFSNINWTTLKVVDGANKGTEDRQNNYVLENTNAWHLDGTLIDVKPDYKYHVQYVCDNGDGLPDNIDKPSVQKGATEIFEIPKKEGYVVTVTNNNEVWDNRNISEGENGTQIGTVVMLQDVNITVRYTKRSDLSYTVNYLEKGTNKPLISSMKVTNQAFGTEITPDSDNVKKSIPGYEFKSASKEKLTIGVDENQNVINLYYEKMYGVESEDKTRVYVYLHIYLDEGQIDEALKDTQLNKHGWYTIGYIDVPLSVLPSATGISRPFEFTQNAPIVDLVKQQFSALQIHVGNHLDIDINDVQQWTLKAENGATDYESEAPSGTAAWHLDGIYTIAPDKLGYTVNYLEKDTNAILCPQEPVTNQTLGTVISLDSVKKKKIPGYKYDHADKDTLTIQVGNNVINLYYVKDDTQTKESSYTVKYTFDGVERADLTKKYTASLWRNEKDESIAVQEGSIDRTRFAGYTFESITPNVAVGDKVEKDATIILNYVSDRLIDPTEPSNPGGGDNIPDRYQIGVNYAAINGSVSFGSTVVTKRDAAGKPAENGTAVLAAAHIPIARPNEGFGNGTWDKEPKVGTEVKNDETLTITYVAEEDTMSDPSRDPDDDPTNGDGIPDRYQIRVNYAAVNGSVSFGSTVVTKYTDGELDENGTAVLAAAHIPTARANEGYGNGTWDKVPAVGTVVTDGETLTITYVAAAATPDDTDTPATPGTTPTAPAAPAAATPAAPAPAAPAAPAAPVPAAPAAPLFAPPAPAIPAVLTPITPLATPTVQNLTDAVADVQELVNAADQDTPLANNLLEDLHICCIFHFLVMLAAMILLVCYTSSAKKRQKKIFALREELQVEKTKRGIL